MYMYMMYIRTYAHVYVKNIYAIEAVVFNVVMCTCTCMSLFFAFVCYSIVRVHSYVRTCIILEQSCTCILIVPERI